MVYHANNLSRKFCDSILAISFAANVQISQERIDALLAVRVFHFNASDARNIDSICNARAMQCLTGYS